MPMGPAPPSPRTRTSAGLRQRTARPDQRDQHRLAEIRLQDQRHDGDGQQQDGERRAGDIRAVRTFREGPCNQQHEGRLEELRGLKRSGRQSIASGARP